MTFLRFFVVFGRFPVPLCSILPHIKVIVNDICDNKCNKHKADFGGNYCVEYDGITKPPCVACVGSVSKGITLRRNSLMPTQPNVATPVRLFSCTAVNDTYDFFLFFFGNSDAFQSLTGTAVRTNQRLIISSGKGRNALIFHAAIGTNPHCFFSRFHFLHPFR